MRNELAGMVGGALLTCCVAVGQAPHSIVVVLPPLQVVGPAIPGSTSLPVLGCFVWDGASNTFYIGTFGNYRSFRRYDSATATSVEYVSNSDTNRYAVSGDVPGGVTSGDHTGALNPSGFVMNPTTLVVGGITYPPRTLIFTVDNGPNVFENGSTLRRNWTKRMTRWDMRAIDAPTTVQPDYSNAQFGDPAHTVVGRFGYADWNDVFTALLDDYTIWTAAGQPAMPSTSGPNIGRQQAFSTDGKWIYFCGSDSRFGGIWRIHAETGTLTWIYPNTLDPGERINTEPCVLATAVRDMDPGNPGVGDQVFFQGSTLSGNYGGIDYLLTDGQSVTGPFPAITKSQFSKYVEWNGRWSKRLANADGSDPGVLTYGDDDLEPTSMAVDTDGTIYFTDNSNQQSIWRWHPTQGLSGVRPRDLQIQLAASQGGTSTSGQALRMQVRHVSYTGSSGSFDVPQILHMSAALARHIIGVYVFKPGDFNRDNTVDDADRSVLLTAMAAPETFLTNVDCSNSKGILPDCTYSDAGDPVPPPTPHVWERRYWEIPAKYVESVATDFKSADSAGYTDYLECDLNNNGLVTAKDRFLFWRFAYPGRSPLDYDSDGDVDMDDFGHLQACVSGSGVMQRDVACVDAWLDHDADVDADDVAVFAACASGPAIPADPDCPL